MPSDHDILLEIRSIQKNFQAEVRWRLDKKQKLLKDLDERLNELEKMNIRSDGYIEVCKKDILELEEYVSALRERELASKDYVSGKIIKGKEENRRSLKVWITVVAMVFTAIGVVGGIIIALLTS